MRAQEDTKLAEREGLATEVREKRNRYSFTRWFRGFLNRRFYTEVLHHAERKNAHSDPTQESQR